MKIKRILRENGESLWPLVPQKDFEKIVAMQGDNPEIWVEELRSGGQYATAGFIYRVAR